MSSDFVNSDDCIGKPASKSIRLYPVFIFKIDLSIEKFFHVKNKNFRYCGSFCK